MKLNYITMMVRNLSKSTAFYEDLAGLKTVRRFPAGPGEIAFLANGDGETMLVLIQFPNEEKVSATALVLSFAHGPDLEALREKAVSLGYAPSEIIQSSPKPHHFRLQDPDGITVEFSV